MIEFTVYGIPAPQGSKSRDRFGNMFESSKALKPWRTAVSTTFLTLRGRRCFTGPLALSVVFYMPKGKSVKRSLPAVKPDLDKLTRAVMDALKHAGAYLDDSQVCQIKATKVYSSGSNVGARFRILEVKELEMGDF